MPRNALPQNYLKTPGTIFEEFENVADWSITSGNGTVAENTQDVKTGSKSVTLTVTASGSNVAIDKVVSLDLSKSVNKMINVLFYCPVDPATILGLSFYLSSTSGYTKYFNAGPGGTKIHRGWNLVTIHRDDWTNTGGESWDNTMIRLRVRLTANAGQVCSIVLDSLQHSSESIGAKCLFTFDDGYMSAYVEGTGYMDSKGLRGTHYIFPTGLGTAGYMTKTELDDAYSKGWAIANHTWDHTKLDTLATQTEMEEKIKLCTDWLNINGYTRSAYHLCYPVGGCNDLTLAAVTKLGIKTARTTVENYEVAPSDDLRLLVNKQITQTTTLAQAKSYVDYAIKTGSTVIFLFHKLTAAGSLTSEWPIADFRALVDYVVETKIPCLTIDEWYEGLTNPRYRSIPVSRV